MASFNIARRLFALRSLAAATLVASAAQGAMADITLSFNDNGTATTASLISANVNVSRMPQWDMETGMIAAELPETLSSGPVFVTRQMDAKSVGFIAAVVSGETVGDMSITFDSGMTWTLKGARLNNYGTYHDGTDQIENFEIVPVQTDITLGERTVSVSAAPAG